MYAYRPNLEQRSGFQSVGNPVPIGIPAESGKHVQPRAVGEQGGRAGAAAEAASALNLENGDDNGVVVD